jgi:hypothetical protein
MLTMDHAVSRRGAVDVPERLTHSENNTPWDWSKVIETSGADTVSSALAWGILFDTGMRSSNNSIHAGAEM